ncbi:FHA domain-containing protein [Streptomyces sp. LP11]|uniref:FHA domain-containing protein n=1 Tax=Streptomyces pyxinicus TaxID=2970331 RepID=A0ABT2B214_9ACTN|nr:FHA domain-containing protein [Streptomyces sp. LP11]MCS0602560.1 FHA domain-containing protein [Streptomyces sp. LP11]
MQIRLTVVDPLGPSPQRGRAASRDVLVTAPTGTDLAAVASALAGAVAGEGGTGRDTGGAPVVLYAGTDRLDLRRCVLGEPPLVDGAVLSLGAPAAAEPHPELDDAPTQLHVVAGPDAGGVHLLHGGRITVGRSAEADVPLDDPDVSRLHCAVTVGADGRVAVADLDSTNGTTLDGERVGERAVRFPAGALLRIGESALRVTPSGGTGARVGVVADGEGCVRVPAGGAPGAGSPGGPADVRPPSSAYGSPGGREHRHAEPLVVPGQAAAPGIETRGAFGDTHVGRLGVGGSHEHGYDLPVDGGHLPMDTGRLPVDTGRLPMDTGREGTPAAETDVPAGTRRRGLGAWARRLAGARAEPPAGALPGAGPAEPIAEAPAPTAPHQPDTWPDPAALLLTALGPGPRLWERGPGHPEALTLRLGTADRSAPDGTGPLPAVPVTAALREAGALGLAGPRPRLSGLVRSVLAQLAALHSPDLLEIVLISADRSRPVEDRAAEWSWLGWLPHVRPGHGQDCRLLLAYDREQAAARTEELLRRLDDHAATGRSTAHPAASGPPPAPAPTRVETPGTPATDPDASARRPSWARDGQALAAGGTGFPGPYTVVVVDGDPGGSALRDALARLAAAGPRAGIHLVCLAETDPASAASPVTRTYEDACAVTPAFRHCGAVALLGGDVAAALHLMRVGPGGPVGPGTVAAVDAVSPAWAERFARALAPLRPDGPVGEPHARVAVPLPRSARLLDELGLARATPASLMARWADAADDARSVGGRARAVLGAGPRGPLTADLVADGPHLLVEGPAGSGRTELLRAVVASLAAAERPDRLGIVLIDGRDGVGSGAGRDEGLRTCTDIPHVTTHLAVNDPVRMREFAQSLSAELKRRAELLGRADFADWHAGAGRGVPGRVVAQRTAPGGDIESPPSSTLRLRPGGAARQRAEAAPPLPRLVVVVDDLDALVSPPLGSPGRPAAGSVMRALEAVAREGERLGLHLVAAAGAGGRTAESEPARRATLRVTLDAPQPGPDEPAPGRGRLTGADGRATDFQSGRVTGRIPRTATQRPTVVPLDWRRMGDPPTRRPVRELGNGPTDLALLASAVERAARQVSATEVPSLL